MANDLNLCQFIGRLGNDPEIRTTPSGSDVANISIAVGSSWKDKQTGQKQERTEWVRCTAFGNLAGIIRQYLTKGSRIYVSGEWRTNKWQDKDGQDRYSTELNIRNMQMLDSRDTAAKAQPAAQQSQPVQSQQGVQGPDDYEDDIPFFPHEYRTIA